MAEALDAALPHRPPFRFVDAVDELTDERAVIRYAPRAGDPLWALVYAGHYPGAPVTPGVLLCEIAFQAGAVLMGRRLEQEGGAAGKVPVVTRIVNAKFRRMVAPGENLRATVTLVERLAGAFVLKGTVATGAGDALRVEFMVALADAAPRGIP